MRIEVGMRTARELVNFGGEAALAIAAMDELRIYNEMFDRLGYCEANRRLSNRSRLLLGIAWSEFFAEDNPDNDAELYRAAMMAGVIRHNLGIDEAVFYERLTELYGS